MRLNKASVTGFVFCFVAILFGIATNGGIEKILLPVGVLLSLVSAIVMLTRVDDMANIGRCFYVLLLSLVYAFVVKIIVEVMIAKSE